MKQLFVQILINLKEKRNLIKLAIVNMNGLVNGILGEDSFIGLELESQNAMKMKEV